MWLDLSEEVRRRVRNHDQQTSVSRGGLASWEKDTGKSSPVSVWEAGDGEDSLVADTHTRQSPSQLWAPWRVELQYQPGGEDFLVSQGHSWHHLNKPQATDGAVASSLLKRTQYGCGILRADCSPRRWPWIGPKVLEQAREMLPRRLG